MDLYRWLLSYNEGKKIKEINVEIKTNLSEKKIHSNSCNVSDIYTILV